jgi:hypothetical protein
LPSNIDGVWKTLQRQEGLTGKEKSREQAARVSWRILKDWVAAQMAIVEAGAAQLAEVFLPYAVHKDGKTMFQMFANQQKALSEGAGR